MSSMSDLDAVSVAIGVVVGAIIATVATTRGSGAKKPKEGFKSPKPVVYYCTSSFTRSQSHWRVHSLVRSYCRANVRTRRCFDAYARGGGH